MVDFARLAIEITTNGANRAATDLKNLESGAKRAERAVDSYSVAMRALQRLMAVGIGAASLSSFIQMADTMQSLRSQLAFVTDGVTGLAGAQKELFDIAQSTRGSLEATTTLFVRSSRALQDYGYSQQQVLKFTDTLNKAMAVGGVGAQEQASALFQLSQALGSGTLQGDEFRTIAEAAPIILDTVAKYMGRSRAEVKKLASEGQITSKLLVEAITGASGQISAQFDQMPLTFGQAMTQMQNSALKFADDLNQSAGITANLANAVSYLAQHFDTLAGVIGLLAGAHLSKFAVSMAGAAVATRQQAVANIALAQTEIQRLNNSLSLATAERNRLVAERALTTETQRRAQITQAIAVQQSRLTALTNAQATATRNLAAAQSQASVAGRALSGVMGLLGGPVGVITIAAGALFYFWNQAEEARQKALDLEGVNQQLAESYEHLSANAMAQRIYAQNDAIKAQREEMERLATKLSAMKVNQGDGWLQNSAAKIREVANSYDVMREKLELMLKAQTNMFAAHKEKLLEAGKSIYEVRAEIELMNPPVEVMRDLFSDLSAVAQNELDNTLKNLGITLIDVKQGSEDFNSSMLLVSNTASSAQAPITSFSAQLDSLNSSAINTANGFYVLGAAMREAMLTGKMPVMSDDNQAILDKLTRTNAITVAQKNKDGKTWQRLMVEQEMAGHKKLNPTDVGYEKIYAATEQKYAMQWESMNSKTASGSKKAKNHKSKTGGASGGKNYAEDWAQYYDELKRASASAWEQIGLNEQRTLNDLQKHIDRGVVSFSDAEKVKMLIAERYAKERLAIAEQYAPELQYAREQKEKLTEISGLKTAGVLTEQQAVRAEDKVKWDTGKSIAEQAGYNAVSEADRFKATYDEGYEWKNQIDEQLAYYKSMNEQKLISDEEYAQRKKAIELEVAGFAISNMSSIADSTLSILKNTAGESSGIYKTMFAINKAFAIAQSIINIQTALGQASASAPFPANLAAMATVAAETANIVSTISSVTLSGMAHSGIDNVPREGTWLLDKGERVVDSRTNADLKAFLQNQSKNTTTAGGKQSISVQVINNGEPVQAEVTSEDKDGETKITVQLLKQVRAIAKQEANSAIMNNFTRAGGQFAR